ncbi:MAG: hypothetical protein ACXVUL_18680 [Solirubrobacteraceae bacterium]
MPAATGEALTVDVMSPCPVPGWVVAAGIVGPAASAELAVEAPGLDAVPALDVVLVEPPEPEVDGWSVVGCVSTVGAGAPDAGEPEDAPLGGGWEVPDGGVGAGEVVVGGGVLAVVVGGGGVAVGGQAAGVPVASGSVGVHVTCAVAGPAGSAIDALGATTIVASCRRPAHATAHSPRCARLDMHVL